MFLYVFDNGIHERVGRQRVFFIVRSSRRIREVTFHIVALLHQAVDLAPQDFHVERFRDVIVSTRFDTGNHIFALDFGCQHHDRRLRHLGIVLDLTAGLVAVFHRHHDITKDQVRLFFQSDVYPILAIAGFQYLVFLIKDMLQEPTYLVAVVDHKEFLSGFLLLRNHMDQFGDLFFLAGIQFDQVGFGFHKLDTTVQQMLLAKRDHDCVGSAVLVRLASVHTAYRIGHVHDLLQAAACTFVFIQPLVCHNQCAVGFSVFIYNRYIECHFPINKRIFEGIRQ